MDKETREYSVNIAVQISKILWSADYQLIFLEPKNEGDVYRIVIAVEDLFSDEQGGVAIGILPLIIKGENHLVFNCISAVSEIIKEETKQEVEKFIKLQNELLLIGNIFISHDRVCLKYTDIELMDYIDEERFIDMVELVIHQAIIMAKKSQMVINGELSVEEVLLLDVLKGG